MTQSYPFSAIVGQDDLLLATPLFRSVRYLATLSPNRWRGGGHGPRGQRIREALSVQYALSVREPNIQIYSADIRGDRSLTLRHVQDLRRPLAKTVYPVIRHLHQLWGFPVKLESVEEGEIVRRYQWPLPEEEGRE